MEVPPAEDKGRTGSNKEEEMKVQVETKLYAELGGLKSILLAYLKQYGPTHSNTLVREFGCSESAMKRALADLKNRGYIDKDRRITGAGWNLFWE